MGFSHGVPDFGLHTKIADCFDRQTCCVCLSGLAGSSGGLTPPVKRNLSPFLYMFLLYFSHLHTALTLNMFLCVVLFLVLPEYPQGLFSRWDSLSVCHKNVVRSKISPHLTDENEIATIRLKCPLDQRFGAWQSISNTKITQWNFLWRVIVSKQAALI